MPINVVTMVFLRTRRAIVLAAACALLLACTLVQSAVAAGGRDKSFGRQGFVFPTDGKAGTTVDDVRCVSDRDGNLQALVKTHTRRAYAKERLADGAFLVKVTRSGALAKGFGSRGVVKRLSPRVPSDIKMDPRGRTLLVSAKRSRGRQFPSWQLSRLTWAGKLDRSFGRRGRLRLPVKIASDRSPSITPLPSGRIAVLAFTTQSDGSERQLLLVTNPNGRLDTSFGSAGTRVTEFKVDSVSEFGGNRIMLAGASPFVAGGANSVMTSRLFWNGKTDRDYGVKGFFSHSSLPESVWGGYLPTSPNGRSDAYHHDSVIGAVRADGSMQLAVITYLPRTAAGERAVAWSLRVNPGGAIDGGYGTGGGAFLKNLDQALATDDSADVRSTVLPLSDGRAYGDIVLDDLAAGRMTKFSGQLLTATGQPTGAGAKQFSLKRFSATASAFDPKVRGLYACGFYKNRLAITKFKVR